MDHNSVGKKNETKIQNYMYIFISQEESFQNFKINSMKNLGLEEEKRIWMEGMTDGMTGKRGLTHTDEGHFYRVIIIASPSPSTSGRAAY